MAFFTRHLAVDLLLTALAPAIWGTTYIVTSQFLPPDRPFIAALLRVLPAGIALLLWSRQFPQRGEWWKLIITGILNIGAFQALLFIAAYRLPGGLAAVIGAIQPLLVMLLAWCVDRQRSPWLAVVSACAGIIGMAMLLLSPRTVLDSLGIGAAFLGAVSMALGTWLSRRWALSLPVVAMTRLAIVDRRDRVTAHRAAGGPAVAQHHPITGGRLCLAVCGRSDAGVWIMVPRYQPIIAGGGIGNEPAKSGDGGAAGVDLSRAEN